MQNLKDKKIQQLDKKYQNIKKQRQINQLARQQEQDPEQDQQYIREQVKNKANLIQKAIENAKETTKTFSKEQKQAFIQKQKEKNRALQEFVASKSFCLPSFLLKQFQSTVDSISADLAELKQVLLPKGKFSFKSKVAKKKETKEGSLQTQHQQQQQLKAKSLVQEDARDYIVTNERDKVILISNDILTKKDKENVRISNIQNSKIVIPAKVKALYVKDISDCQLFVGAVQGGSHLTKLQRCEVHLATHQLRIHQSKDTKFYVISRSEPIIESCDQLIFSPQKMKYKNFESDLTSAGLFGIKNKYAEVQDFKWHKQIQNPHWKLGDGDIDGQLIDLDQFKV